MIDTKEARIKIHEYWMAFRRNYYKIKEWHRPKITHQEVEDMLFHIISDFDRVEEIILKPSTLLSQPSAEGSLIIAKSDKSSVEDLPSPETAVSASPKGEFS